MPRMITVLEDCVRYRDGKKWKRRHCFLSKTDSKKSTVTMFITKQFGANIFNQEVDDKSARQYIIDEISGFEHGRHVDKESQVMALIGCSVVYCVAFEQTETMFRWAETLNKLLTSVNFHVTLKKVSETSGIFNRVTVGTQGNLHVQPNRLCLIGEPADGNKFIYEWSAANLIAVDISDTNYDKTKKLFIKSNGKIHKGKGVFEFEISFPQLSIFEETFTTFLTTCKSTNPEFTSNFALSLEPLQIGADNMFSYSITCRDLNGSNSDNSSSFEKRSSEIPIPRSREHSGSHQRPTENAQIKTRKTNNNVPVIWKGIPKHYSMTEAMCQYDNEACLFPDDNDNVIEDLPTHDKAPNLFSSAISQQSSGVYLTGASDSMKDTDLSLQTSVNHDSECAHLFSKPLPTSCNAHHDTANRTVSSSIRKKNHAVLSFYRHLNRNPLSLNNYTNYYRLLHSIMDKNSATMRRSNSFNCVYIPEMKVMEFRRKFSNTNFPLNLTSKESEQQFKVWKDKIERSNIDNVLASMHIERDHSKKDQCTLLLSKRLPFYSMKDFHASMIRSLQSGTVCFNLFSYHHFLSIMKDVRTVIKNIEAKLTLNEAAFEYSHSKDFICRKSKVYNHWLERIQSYSRSSEMDQTEPSILDINILLVFEIMDTVLLTRSGSNRRLCDVVLSHKANIAINPIGQLTGITQEPITSNVSLHRSFYRKSQPMMSTSYSTPDFWYYSPQEQEHTKFRSHEARYQKISGPDNFDAINHTYPKYALPLSKPISPDNKEGSFQRFRRKYSPNVLIPFMRRKTSSIHSTLSEPICSSATKDQNLYYNLANRLHVITKNPRTVTVDNCNYVNVRQGPSYINMSNISGPSPSTESSLYDDNTPYPDEIEDPSMNYGDLSYIKSRMRYSRQHDPDNSYHGLNFRRSSLSILSQKSLQNYGTVRSVSFNKRGSAKISRVHSDACNHRHNHSSTDYINVSATGSSPLSLPSCYPPPSLNYITVNENSICHDFSRKFCKPLSVSTHHDGDNDDYEDGEFVGAESGDRKHSAHVVCARRAWLSPPRVDYCQIDVQCTYALRDIDQMLADKIRSRQTNSCPKNVSPDDIQSLQSIEQMSDTFSLTFSSSIKDKSKCPKRTKKYFQRLFARKCESTN